MRRPRTRIGRDDHIHYRFDGVTTPLAYIDPGTLTGPDTVTVTGALTWTGGTMSGTGVTTNRQWNFNAVLRSRR